MPAHPHAALLAEFAAGHQLAQRLIDEERIAACTVLEQRRKRTHRLALHVKRGREQQGHVVARKWGESQVGHEAYRAKRTQREAQVVVERTIRLIPAGHQKHTFPAELSAHEMQQLDRRTVGPLQVLEAQQQRLSLAETAEQLQNAGVQPQALLRQCDAVGETL